MCFLSSLSILYKSFRAIKNSRYTMLRWIMFYFSSLYSKRLLLLRRCCLETVISWKESARKGFRVLSYTSKSIILTCNKLKRWLRYLAVQQMHQNTLVYIFRSDNRYRSSDRWCSSFLRKLILIHSHAPKILSTKSVYFYLTSDLLSLYFLIPRNLSLLTKMLDPKKKEN